MAFGVDVGFGVGFAVGAGVGSCVGLGVGWGVLSGPGVFAGGLLAPDAGSGVGVGPSATMGPSVGDADAVGSDDGGLEGATDGSEPGWDGVGVVAGVPLELGSDAAGDAVVIGGGVAEARATSVGGWLGVTAPAVSATVARMRFNTPMATTRRAR